MTTSDRLRTLAGRTFKISSNKVAEISSFALRNFSIVFGVTSMPPSVGSVSDKEPEVTIGSLVRTGLVHHVFNGQACHQIVRRVGGTLPQSLVCGQCA